MILHILNGDAMLPDFQEAGIEGDILVWREALCEGSLIADISSLEFWDDRSEWIGKTYGETKAGYNHKMLDELAKLDHSYTEIILWFEFDLFCQANLLGALAYIRCQPHLQNTQISLICPDSFPGMADFRGLGELNASQLASLYPGRKTLTADGLETAHQAWQAFAAQNADVLETWLARTTPSSPFSALLPALQAHLKNLRTNAAGLTYIEQKLLDIHQSGATSFPAIYREFWRTEPIYGLGDLQLLTYLQKLQDRGLIYL
ncbi:hypothetical protein C8P68_102779 [Mucilaginibacter yixingensis]|uniref:DUF1835 domain-containing protein n=1 Tax=Mucilaginibacter yixingensis TaxID=1295612 RepID=A0A2T5JDW4_9SPHI|nr:hypothetical protein [Mucilaginibacter yixingensis]PTQ99948.1 hypothetical protein C8P68_102779 [Mucilaginibacter yixingensis]